MRHIITDFVIQCHKCDEMKSGDEKQYILDLVVTEEVKTRTQGIVRAQWNESNWYVTDFVLLSYNIHQ